MKYWIISCATVYFFSVCYLADGAKSGAHLEGLLAQTRTDYYGLLQKNNDKSQNLSYTEISAFSDNTHDHEK
jgi:hypothetical protein